MPIRVANNSAPAPESKTKRVLVITKRASMTGLFTVVTPATAPHASVLPSIMHASSSCVPSAVNAAPTPALKPGSSSSARTTASHASRAVPFFASTSRPTCNAICNERSYAAVVSGGEFFSMVPAPPCRAIAHRSPDVAVSDVAQPRLAVINIPVAKNAAMALTLVERILETWLGNIFSKSIRIVFLFGKKLDLRGEGFSWDSASLSVALFMVPG